MKKSFFIFSLCLGFLLATPSLASAQSFEEALAKAYETHPGLEAARALLRATDEKIAEAKGGYRPQISADAAIGTSQQNLSKGNMLSGHDSLTPRSAGLQIVQPVFKGFRTENAVKTAHAEIMASRAALSNKEQQVLLQTAQAYLDVLESQMIVRLTRSNVNVLREQVKATQKRFDLGEVTKTDVAQALARLQAAGADYARAEGNEQNDRAAFMRLTGAPPLKLRYPSLKLSLPASLEDALAVANKNNPLIEAALYAHEAAQHGLDQSVGAFLPEIDIVGETRAAWEESLMLPKEQTSSTLMARLRIPLYQAGQSAARTRAARETMVGKKLELEDMRRMVREQLVRAWQNLQTARAGLKAYHAEVKAGELALYGVKEETKVGARTTLDVLNARQELLSAKVNLVRAKHDKDLALLQVRAAMGQLHGDDLGLGVKAYDPKEHYDQVKDKWYGIGG